MGIIPTLVQGLGSVGKVAGNALEVEVVKVFVF